MHPEHWQEDQPDPYAHVRPTPRNLLLLIRAAFVDDGRGGPWLYACRNSTEAGTRVYIHTVTLTFADWITPHRLLMLTGDEALAYVAEHRWPSVTDPTVGELRALGDYAVELRHADRWAADPLDPDAKLASTDALGDDQAEKSRAAARGLRWQMAERWLRQPAR